MDCRWQPWCSISQYDTFGDQRSLISLLTPVPLTETEVCQRFFNDRTLFAYAYTSGWGLLHLYRYMSKKILNTSPQIYNYSTNRLVYKFNNIHGRVIDYTYFCMQIGILVVSARGAGTPRVRVFAYYDCRLVPLLNLYLRPV